MLLFSIQSQSNLTIQGFYATGRKNYICREMIREKRFEYIISSLKNTGTVTYSGMSVDLSVSEDTVRRDIDYLDENGLLSKVRGERYRVIKIHFPFRTALIFSLRKRR